MRKVTSTVLVIVIAALHSVRGQTVGECTDVYQAQIKSGGLTCSLIQDFIKCTIKSAGWEGFSKLTKEDFALMKVNMESQFAKQGVNCNLDMMAIEKELTEEYRSGVVIVTRPPVDYENAVTFGQCMDTLGTKVRGGITCDLFEPYLKCTIRTLKLYTEIITDEGYKLLDRRMKDEMAQSGFSLNCDVDYKAIFEEVQREENAENGSDVSMRPSQLIAVLSFTVISTLITCLL